MLVGNGCTTHYKRMQARDQAHATDLYLRRLAVLVR